MGLRYPKVDQLHGDDTTVPILAKSKTATAGGKEPPSLARNRPLLRRISGEPSIAGQKGPSVPCPDDAPLAARWLRLCPPYSSLESVIEQNKEGYYLSLRRTQGTIRTTTPDWNPWVEFFLRALQRQKQRLETKMERERIILGALPDFSVSILELARERGRVTGMEAAQITGASGNTVKDHLRALTRDGHLTQKGAGRGTWYGLS